MRCALAVLFWLALLASASAQESPLPMTASPPEASETLSEQLERMATTLEQALTASATDWETLSAILTSHSQKLEELATLSRDLERETESMRESLRLLGISLDDSISLANRQGFELWIWRIGTALGFAAAGYFALTD
jgi:TolA-binding protein